MRQFIVVIVTVSFAHCSLAVESCSNAVQWFIDSPTVVIGSVVSKVQAEPRELGWPRMEGWLFPHEIARVAVVEVLKDCSGRGLAAGDTVSVVYTTEYTSTNQLNPGWEMVVKCVQPLCLEPGQIGAMDLTTGEGEGEWTPTSRTVFFGDVGIGEIRSVASGLSVENWIESAPTVVVVDVSGVRGEHRRLANRDHPRCDFPHGVWSLAVVEVLRNLTDCPVAEGDSITVTYPLSNVGSNPAEPGVVVKSEGILRKRLKVGERYAVALFCDSGEWHPGPYYFYRLEFEVPAIRAALGVENRW
ncbi:MAG: hypothetical protein R3D98_10855 [Candidatus Krumholzibacteriia bacterium]